MNDEERCMDCGAALDLDGYDGRCGNCADRRETVLFDTGGASDWSDLG